jgi:hypothetical protein
VPYDEARRGLEDGAPLLVALRPGHDLMIIDNRLDSQLRGRILAFV